MTLDHEDVEAIALRVAELVAPRPATLLDARELADRLGVKRAWVYSHAAMLGAVRLGAGPRARLRFDLELARRAATSVGWPNGRQEQAPKTVPRPQRRRVAPGVKLIEGRSGR